MAKKLRALKVDEADWLEWGRLAKAAGLGLSEWIRERCNETSDERRERGRGERDGGDNRGVDVRRGSAMDTVKRRGSSSLDAARERSSLRDDEASSVAGAVAKRTGHSVGCDCFQCAQAARFIRSMRKSAKK
jgi:hypothetical protein